MGSVKHCALLRKGPTSFCMTGAGKFPAVLLHLTAAIVDKPTMMLPRASPWTPGQSVCTWALVCTWAVRLYLGSLSVLGQSVCTWALVCTPLLTLPCILPALPVWKGHMELLNRAATLCPGQALTAVWWSEPNQPKIHLQLVAAEVFVSLWYLRKKCVVISALLKKTQTNKSWFMGPSEILTFPLSMKLRTAYDSGSCSCPGAWQSPQTYTQSTLAALWPLLSEVMEGLKTCALLCSQLCDTGTALQNPACWKLGCSWKVI